MLFNSCFFFARTVLQQIGLYIRNSDIFIEVCFVSIWNFVAERNLFPKMTFCELIYTPGLLKLASQFGPSGGRSNKYLSNRDPQILIFFYSIGTFW